MRKKGPATSSSRNPSFSRIRVIAMSSTSTPASSAANSAANATSSRVVHCFPWNRAYAPGSFCFSEAASPV